MPPVALLRCSVVEKQRRMGMPECMEPTARKTKTIEDRRQHVLRNICRSQEAAIYVQEQPFAFQCREVFANDPHQSFGQWQDRSAGWGFWGAPFPAPDGAMHGEQFPFEVEIADFQRKNFADP